jgi:hypothetical protein
MPFLIGEKTKLSKEISILEVSNPNFPPAWHLPAHRYFSPADDKKGISYLSLATNEDPFLIGFDLEVSEEELEFLFVEFRKERDVRERSKGFYLKGLLCIKLCQLIIDIFGGWIDP